MAKSTDDLRARLQAAALKLFREHGYERVTAAQIAAHAGVTERTFFRYFADKREVLFDGETLVRTTLLEAIKEAPAGLSLIEVLLRSFLVFAPVLEARRSYAKPRHDLIASTPALQERELAKIADLSEALSNALKAREPNDLRAGLAAQVGVAAFVQATLLWMEEPAKGLSGRIESAFAELEALLRKPA